MKSYSKPRISYKSGGVEITPHYAAVPIFIAPVYLYAYAVTLAVGAVALWVSIGVYLSGPSR